MNVLHVIQRYWPCVGGSERYFQEISERLVKAGHNVTVLTTDAHDPEYFWLRDRTRIRATYELHNNVVVHRLAVKHWPLSGLLYHRVRRLMSALSAFPFDTSPILALLSQATPRIPSLSQAFAAASRFDLVHVGNVLFEPLVAGALRYARERRIPFVFTPFVHLGVGEKDGVRENYTNRYQLKLIRAADKVIAQTDIELRYLAAIGVPSDKLVKIGVGVNPEEILGGDGGRFRHKYEVDEQLVFFLGSQSFDKGVRDLLEAMKRLWRRGCKAKLALAGPITQHFARYFDAQPDWVRQRCLQLGVVDDDEKRDLLAAGDVLVLPSRTDSFGIVFLEAWLYSKPVIGAKAGGIPDVIEHGQDGLLVPYGEVAEIEKAVEHLLGDPAWAKALGQRGCEKVLREHTWDHKFNAIERVYRELCT